METGGPVGYSTADAFGIDLPGLGQAGALRFGCNPRKGEILGFELPFHRLVIGLPGQLLVKPDPQEPGRTHWLNHTIAPTTP